VPYGDGGHQGEREVVDLIVDLYTQRGLGAAAIVRTLSERGVTSRRGGRMSIAMVERILQRQAAAGRLTLRRRDDTIPQPRLPVTQRIKAALAIEGTLTQQLQAVAEAQREPGRLTRREAVAIFRERIAELRAPKDPPAA
jgi:hypothetical protein